MSFRVDGEKPVYGKHGVVFKEETIQEPKEQKEPVTVPIVANKPNNEDMGLKVEKQAEETPKANDAHRVFADRKIQSKEDLKTREYEVRVQMYKARSEGKENFKNMTNEEIQEQAKLYAKNEKNGEDFNNTVVYYDKAEYKAAEKERKEAKKALVEHYRAEGFSKKEAKKKADANLVENKYLRKTWFGIHSSRKAVNNNKDKFFENGKFSNEKYHNFILEQANRGNKNKGEATNYEFQLKERKEADAANVLEHTSKTTLGKLARKAGMKTERDNTALYRGAFITATTATAAALGAATGGIGSASSAFSSNISGAGALAGGSSAASGATAAAAGEASAHIGGALLGTAAGLTVGGLFSNVIKDKGSKIKHIYEIPQDKPQVQNPPADNPPVVNPPVDNPPVEDCPITKIEKQITIEQDVPTCNVTLKKGQTLYDTVRDGFGLTVIGNNGQIGNKDHKFTMRVVNYVKSTYGLKPNDKGALVRKDWAIPLEFEGKQFDCDAKIHGTNKGYGNAKGANQGVYTNPKENIPGIQYGNKDCNNNVKWYNSKKDRDEAYDKMTQKK